MNKAAESKQNKQEVSSTVILPIQLVLSGQSERGPSTAIAFAGF